MKRFTINSFTFEIGQTIYGTNKSEIFLIKQGNWETSIGYLNLNADDIKIVHGMIKDKQFKSDIWELFKAYINNLEIK